MKKEKPSAAPEKLSATGELPVSDITAEYIRSDVARMVRDAAGDRTWADNVKAGIRRSSMRLGIQANQAKRLWYGEQKTIPAELYLTIKRRYDELCAREAKALRQDIELQGTRADAARERLDLHAAALDQIGDDLSLDR